MYNGSKKVVKKSKEFESALQESSRLEELNRRLEIYYEKMEGDTYWHESKKLSSFEKAIKKNRR